MAVLDYQGSLAQNGVSFSTSITYTTVPGQNFYQIGLFIDSIVDATANLIAGWVVNTPISVNSNNYTTYVTSNSRLYNWLVSFFAVNSTSSIFIVPYNGTSHDIASAHTALLTQAYFKMIFFGVGGETAQYKTDLVSLAGSAAGSKGLSQIIVNTSDSNIILASGVGGSQTVDLLITASGYDAMVSYSAVTAYNPMMTAIGVAISYSNAAGTPVGNNLDFNSTGNILPSSNAANSNISSVAVANLASRKVGYFQTVGDGTGNVILNNRLSLLGKVITSVWFVNYVNYYCSIVTATMITTGPGYTFKNNNTYQQILSLISSVVTPFQSRLGRISGLSITAPSFANLPVTGGSVLSIPNAWSAMYNDRVDTVAVTGNLIVNL